MKARKKSLEGAVELLQSQVATILTKLGSSVLACHHKQYIKERQASKLEDDVEFIPISARVKFELKSSKKVEQDEEFQGLVGECNSLISEFQMALKAKILKTIKMEITVLKNATISEVCQGLRMLVQTAATCYSPADVEIDVDKMVNTLLHLYHQKLLVHLKRTKDEFLTLYKREHAIQTLPAPYVTELPAAPSALQGQSPRRTQRGSLPASWLLQMLPKIWRFTEQLFVVPWTSYLDVIKRNEIAFALAKLDEEFFSTTETDNIAMDIDAEAPVDPKILKGMVAVYVAAATKQLQAEVVSLKKALSKNKPRDHPGARKNKSGKEAAGKSKDSGKGDQKKGQTSTRSSNTKKNGTKKNSRGSKARRGRS